MNFILKITIGVCLGMVLFTILQTLGGILMLNELAKEFTTEVERITNNNTPVATKSAFYNYQNSTSNKPLPVIHDNEPPENYPHEWNYISAKSRFCWYHKVTQKAVCKTW